MSQEDLVVLNDEIKLYARLRSPYIVDFVGCTTIPGEFSQFPISHLFNNQLKISSPRQKRKTLFVYGVHESRKSYTVDIRLRRTLLASIKIGFKYGSSA